MERVKIVLCGMVMVFILSGCATTGGKTTQDKRQSILSMRDEVLSFIKYTLRQEPRLQRRRVMQFSATSTSI